MSGDGSVGPVRDDALMMIEAARHVRPEDTVVVGSGVALAVAMLAQKFHAPGVGLVVDSGAIDPIWSALPVSVTDSQVMREAARLSGTMEVLGNLLPRGRANVSLLGAGQVDRHGNINSSYVIDSRGRRVRLPGAGGAPAMTAFAQRILVVMRHERKRFPPRCDYLTSPGYLDGPGGRARAGLPVHAPEIVVVTDLCVFQGDAASGELVVTHLMPGVSEADVRAHTAFEPRMAEPPGRVTPASSEELSCLLNAVDPRGVFLKSPLRRGDPAGSRPAALHREGER